MSLAHLGQLCSLNQNYPVKFPSSAQLLSRVWLFATPRTAEHQFIVLVMPSNHLILCHPLLLLPSIFPSIRVISNESVLCIMWPKYWSFSFSISPSNENSALISFWIDWLDLLAVQETLKGLLQHHSSKASILWHSAFFTDQLSHPYKTTGKTISPAKSAGAWEINAYHYMPLRLYSCLLLGIYWLIQTTSSFFK